MHFTKRTYIALIFTIFLLVLTIVSLAQVRAEADALHPSRVTVVWSPHPDDETLRLTSYTLAARDHGDLLILVAVTDGGGSSVKDLLGISAEQMMNMRISEQTEAWNALTYGRGQIIRLGLPDGHVTTAGVKMGFDKVEAIAKSYHVPIEHYVAATDKDAHPDHRAVANAVKLKGAESRNVVRFSLDPSLPGGGTLYVSKFQITAEAAHQAYDQIGMISVAPLFKALHYHHHYSRIIAPPPVLTTYYVRSKASLRY